MRIGINALTLIPGRTGGVETYITNLLRSLGEVEAENDYVVFALPQAAGALTFSHPNIRVEVCRVPVVPGMVVPLRVAYEQVVLPSRIKRLGIDAMIFTANIGSLRCPCPSVVIIHDLISLYYAQHFRGQIGHIKETLLPRLIAASARSATKVVAISEFTKSEIVRLLGVPAEKITVVYNGVDADVSAWAEDSQGGSALVERIGGPYVLFVGYHHSHKNLVRLVQAFARMKNQGGVPHKLVIAGKEESGTPALLRELKVLGRDDILILGMVGSGDLAALYRSASLFVFPSLIEGFGMPPLEAMACGVPVVAANAGPLPEVVGDAGLLFDPENVDSIADAMRSVLADAELAQRLRDRGYARVSQDQCLSWRNTATAMLGVVRSLAGEP